MANACEFESTFSWYALNSGDAACLSAVASAEIVWLCGPPWRPGEGRGRQRFAQKLRQNCAIIARLEAGEDRLVDRPLEIVHDLVPLLVDLLHALAVEDHRAARPAERLVGGRRDNVRVLERRRDDVGGDEAGDVRHVGQEEGADLGGEEAGVR